MIQLAWIVTDENGTILKRQSHIIRPNGFSIIAEVAQLTRITTDRALREGIALSTALHEFMGDLADANLIVGHNISFDLNIVGCELYRESMAYNDLLNKKKSCTMKCSADFCAIPSNSPYGGYKWPKLEELYRKLFGYTFDGAHDALADVEATRKCYFELKKKGIL
jgi:DNA polymerase III epsilon subunit-like protein